MAQPSIRTSNTVLASGRTQENKHYQSLDITDEQIYNNLGTLYEKAAFIEAIETRLLEIAAGTQAAFTDGDSVGTVWASRKAYLTKKWKTKSRKHRPADRADPPIVPEDLQEDHAAPAGPLPPMPLPLGPPPGPAVVPAPAAVAARPLVPASDELTRTILALHAYSGEPEAGTEAKANESRDAQAEERDPSPPSSPETLAPGSPLYVFTNDLRADTGQILLSPTRGERAHVRAETLDQGWKFVSTLFQTAIGGGNKVVDKDRAKFALNPRKSVGLYVQPDGNGLIVDRLVAKCCDISEDELPEEEVEINRLLHKTGCTHLLRYRGDSVRVTQKRALPESDKRPKEQRVLYMYTEFAQFLDVNSLIDAHVEKLAPISEHFIWYFFSQMVEALSAFQDGKCQDPHADGPLTRKRKRSEDLDDDPGSEDDKKPWKPLVHGDLKSANVFCASENEKYPLWPRVVMADFDLVQAADDIQYRWVGTSGWQPPERNRAARNTENYAPADWEVSVKSDIWA